MFYNRGEVLSDKFDFCVGSTSAHSVKKKRGGGGVVATWKKFPHFPVFSLITSHMHLLI